MFSKFVHSIGSAKYFFSNI